MRILHILDHSIPLHSGYTFRTRAIIQQQVALGWETEHLTSPKHNLAAGAVNSEETLEGLHFFRTKPSAGLIAQLPVLSQWAIIRALEKRLEKVIQKVRPDVLHAHSPALNGVAALRVGRRYGIPVVYEVRAFWEDAAVDHGTSKEWGIRYRITRAMETWVLHGADRVTTICEGLRSDIVARGIPSDKVVVIPNAVDLDKFSAESMSDESLVSQLGLKGKAVLGFIGSFYAYEGLHLLLEAVPSILEKRPDIRVLLVGGGPDEPRLKQLAIDLGIEEHIEFTGRVPHEDVQRYYDLIDIFVYPRLRMRLTDLVTPLKPLEAMARARLVVASDVGGHRELIREGETGELFSAGDSGALAGAVLALLEDKDRWSSRKAAARHFVETERNWYASVARYQGVYEALVPNVEIGKKC